jgi:molybdate transport system substrate-binding protein
MQPIAAEMKFVLAILFLLIFSCKPNQRTEEAKENKTAKEILIYCENVMVPPLMELKKKFELEWNCRIKIHNDCSQNLSSLIRYSLEGDIFFPASHGSFQKLYDKDFSYIIDSIFIGYNSLVVITTKENPTNYTGDISSLMQKKHGVIIANPETSSLGYETRKMLSSSNIYRDVIVNVVALSTDSRGLVKSLKKQEAQVVISWASDIANIEQPSQFEVFSIPESLQSPVEIYAGILSTTNDSTLAKEFLTFAAGDEGLSVFRKYGFPRRKTFIF